MGSVTGISDDAVLTSQVVEAEEGYIERSARAFAESDLVFSRGFSNAPFLPVAFLGSTHYGDANISEEGATPETAGKRYQVNSTSQYAGVPFLLNKRSMVVIGEYLSYSNFSVENGEDFSVASATLAAGYLYQVSDAWQLLGAVAPFTTIPVLASRAKITGRSWGGHWLVTPATNVFGGCSVWFSMTLILARPGSPTLALH